MDAISARVRPMRSASQPKSTPPTAEASQRQRQQQAAHAIVDAELGAHVVEDERVEQHVHRVEHPAGGGGQQRASCLRRGLGPERTTSVNG